MISFFSPFYYLYFLYFFVCVFLAFYIPGRVLMKRYKFDFLTTFVFSLGVGLVLWAIQGFILGFLGLRQLSFLYLLFFGIVYLKLNLPLKKLKMPRIKINVQDLFIAILIATGVFFQLFFTFLNGWVNGNGVYFCCGLPDSLYHIGLTNSLVNNFPPQEPAMAGVVVKNYHYLANLVQADFIRVFRLPLVFTQYQYFPVLISSLIGLSAIVLSRALNQGRIFASFLLLFLFFWGDITYLLTLVQGGGLDFHYPFLFDSTSLWFSPPRAFGSFIFLMGISLFCIWIKKYDRYLGFILALVFASLVGFKIYIGIFVLCGLFFTSLYFIFRQDFKKLILPILALVIGFMIYVPINSGSSGLFFVGFWRAENFIAQPAFNLVHMELARQVFLTHRNYLRVFQYEVMYMALYFIFVLGSLNIAFLQNRKSLKMFPKELNIFLVSGISLSLIIGFLFFQKISGANTSQFIIIAEMALAIYASLACVLIYKNLGRVRYAFVILLILISSPRVLNQVHGNYEMINNNHGLILSKSELGALEFLKKNTSKDSLILTDNKKLKIEKTCYYIGFISQRSLFLCDAEGILGDHGVNTTERLKDYKQIIRSYADPDTLKVIKKNKINYIYTISDDYYFPHDVKELKTVFKNDRIRIIKVIN